MTRPAPRLWIPGPTQVRPEILAECARDMIGHRTPAMTEVLERIDAHLPDLFGFDPKAGARAAVASTSATAMMEAALHGVGDRVLAVVCGAFSKRWADIAESLGKHTRRLVVPPGSAAGADELERALAEVGPVDAVTVVANETSTGVATPLAPLAEVLAGRDPRPLFLVDVVTLAAGAPVDLDAHGIDFAVTGSQKALALPPGLAPFAASQRYRERAAREPRRSWTMDPLRLLEGQASRKPPTTPAIGLHFALARQLEDIARGAIERETVGSPAEGWAARFARTQRLRARVHAFAATHGLCPFPARAEWISPTVACLATGAHDPASLVEGLLAEGHAISRGYGELAGTTVRIGHFGDASDLELEDLLEAAGRVLSRNTRR